MLGYIFFLYKAKSYFEQCYNVFYTFIWYLKGSIYENKKKKYLCRVCAVVRMVLLFLLLLVCIYLTGKTIDGNNEVYSKKLIKLF